MGVIIVEGPERAGKTTLCNALVKKHPGTSMLVHNGPPPEHLQDDPNKGRAHLLDRYLMQAQWAADQGMLVVMDRAHLSEYVMGELYRGLMPDGMQEFEQQLLEATRNVFLVTLAPPHELLFARDDGQSEWDTPDDAQLELGHFCSLHEESCLPKRLFTAARMDVGLQARYVLTVRRLTEVGPHVQNVRR